MWWEWVVRKQWGYLSSNRNICSQNYSNFIMAQQPNFFIVLRRRLFCNVLFVLKFEKQFHNLTISTSSIWLVISRLRHVHFRCKSSKVIIYCLLKNLKCALSSWGSYFLNSDCIFNCTNAVALLSHYCKSLKCLLVIYFSYNVYITSEITYIKY